MDKQPKCPPICNIYLGGEVRHEPSCPFYPESFSKMYDDLKAKGQVWVNATDKQPEVRKELSIQWLDGKWHRVGGWLHEDGFWVTYFGTTRDFSKIKWLDENSMQTGDRFLQGYACAVANMCRLNGEADTRTRELFRDGIGIMANLENAPIGQLFTREQVEDAYTEGLYQGSYGKNIPVDEYMNTNYPKQ